MPDDIQRPDDLRQQIQALADEQVRNLARINQIHQSYANFISRQLTSFIQLGVVIDGYPLARVYRVMSALGRGVHVCRLLTRGSTTLIGAYDADTLPPQTIVWYIMPPGSHFGLIIGAEPPFSTGWANLNDVIQQGSRAGFYTERSYWLPFIRKSFGVADFSGRTPEDSLEAGEFCRVTETGSMIFLDPFMASMRINEACGIWMFFYDLLLRIFGNNLQIWSSISQEEFYNDQGESYYYRGLAFYPWEQLGVLQRGIQPFQEINPTTVQQDRARTFVEPVNRNLKPFHRIQTYGGYAAAGEHEYVASPRRGAALNISDQTEPRSDFFKSVNGMIGMRSLKGIYLVKTPAIFVPERVKRIEDGAGDDKFAGNYQPSVGEHDVFQEKRIIENIEGTNPAELLGSVPEVTLTYLFRYLGDAGFYYHRNDFRLRGPLGPAGVKLSPGGYDLSNYPIAEASIGIDEGGSISLIDGWNSGIRMTNGRIYIDTPTLVLNCGRVIPNLVAASLRDSEGNAQITSNGNIFVEAGGSLVLRAKKSIILAADNVCILARKTLTINSGEQVTLQSNTNINLYAEASTAIESRSGDVKIKSGENVTIQSGGGSSLILYGDDDVKITSKKDLTVAAKCTMTFIVDDEVKMKIGTDGVIVPAPMQVKEMDVMGPLAVCEDVIVGGSVITGTLSENCTSLSSSPGYSPSYDPPYDPNDPPYEPIFDTEGSGGDDDWVKPGQMPCEIPTPGDISQEEPEEPRVPCGTDYVVLRRGAQYVSDQKLQEAGVRYVYTAYPQANGKLDADIESINNQGIILGVDMRQICQ